MGAGLNNGLTLKEIEEVLIQALPYVGYPAIATALAAAAEVIKEQCTSPTIHVVNRHQGTLFHLGWECPSRPATDFLFAHIPVEPSQLAQQK
jgi:hypothetical protein